MAGNVAPPVVPVGWLVLLRDVVRRAGVAGTRSWSEPSLTQCINRPVYRFKQTGGRAPNADVSIRTRLFSRVMRVQPHAVLACELVSIRTRLFSRVIHSALHSPHSPSRVSIRTRLFSRVIPGLNHVGQKVREVSIRTRLFSRVIRAQPSTASLSCSFQSAPGFSAG